MNQKELRKILNESLINPKKPIGLIKIVMETGTIEYFELRAIELIQEARLSNCSLEDYHYKLQSAITLLALARGMKDG